MSGNTRSTVRCSGEQPVACGALVAMACLALASCGAGPGAARPDLVMEDPKVSDPRPAAAAGFTFSATVRNAGRGSAAATTLRVYRSDDAAITPAGEQVGAAAVPELAASESRVVSVELRAPSSSGTHYYGACVHAVAEESHTANNCSTAVQVTVQAPQVPVSGPPGPDLVASVWLVGTRSPAIGGIIDLSGKVLNRGRRTTALTTLRFYRSTDATITRSDTQVATRSVRRLGTGLNQYLLFLKLPSSKGVYYYGACVDAVAGESATTNNCSAAVKVEALQSIPDLWVGSWSVAPLPLREWTSVGTKVLNSGSPSGATTLRLLLLPSQTSKPSAGTQVGEVDVPELVVTKDESASSLRSVSFQPPATPGVYHYVMCVDTVTGESNTANNCTQSSIEFL